METKRLLGIASGAFLLLIVFFIVGGPAALLGGGSSATLTPSTDSQKNLRPAVATTAAPVSQVADVQADSPIPAPAPPTVETKATEDSTGDQASTSRSGKHIFSASDTEMLHKLRPGKPKPRVLIYTWCTEDTLTKFMNEVYWKSCYAHAHGFDVVFSDKKNFSGVAKYTGSNGDKALDEWYSEENMWALWSDIQPFLLSGKYDYVFMMGADVLILETWLHWPVWAWDTGDYDITVMDQHHFPFWYSYGLNENNILFKATDWTMTFIREVFDYRKGFSLQGDNGPYMEGILTSLGREALKEGRLGYYQNCLQFLKLDKPSVLKFNDEAWPRLNDAYEECFFNEVDRLVGRFGYRKSKRYGFYPNFIEYPEGVAYFPADYLAGKGVSVPPNHFHQDKIPLGPWANCWSSVRYWWPTPDKNCFAYHWNGPKDPTMLGHVTGQCPDKSFDWENSQYNPANRGQFSQIR